MNGTNAADERTVPPLAQESLAPLVEALHLPEGDADDTAELIGSDGERVTLPHEMYAILQQVVAAMAEGKAVSIAPRNTVLSTQEAADMLNISRPTLVKLLESGKIRYEKPAHHRRVLLDDVLEYQRSERERRRALLAEMTAEAAADESGDESDNVDDFVPTR